MIDSSQFNRIALVLPILQQGEASFVREFQQVAFFARIPAGRDVFLEGDRVESIALLISFRKRLILHPDRQCHSEPADISRHRHS
jgi:hypothetical protein